MSKILKTIAPLTVVAVIVTAIFAAGIAYIWRKQKAFDRQYTASQLVQTSLPPAAIPQQEPISPEPPSTPAPSVPHIPVTSTRSDNKAPDGIYFLLKRVSATNATGIIGFPPGTPVKLVGNNGDIFRVSSDNIEFEVPREQLTTDLNIARNVAAVDSKTQAALAGIGNTWRLIDEENERKKMTAYKQQQDDVLHPRGSQAEVEPFSAGATQNPRGDKSENPLDRGTYNNKSTFGRLTRQAQENARKVTTPFTPYNEAIYKLQHRIDELQRPLLYEQVTKLSDDALSEIKRLQTQLDTLETLKSAYQH